MHGNVAEWCLSDVPALSLQRRTTAATIPTRPGMKVVRGGSWNDTAAATPPRPRAGATSPTSRSTTSASAWWSRLDGPQVVATATGRSRQVALVDAEGRLGLGQLDVGLPQFLVAPVGDVAAEQVAAFAQGRPVAPRLDLLPHASVARPSAVALDLDLEQAGRAAVLAQQSPTRWATVDRLQALSLARRLDPLAALPRSAARSARASPSPSRGDRGCGRARTSRRRRATGRASLPARRGSSCQSSASNSRSNCLSMLLGVPTM